jgi:hypothetical protein
MPASLPLVSAQATVGRLGSFQVLTLAGDLTIDGSHANTLKIDPAGARDVTLPAVAAFAGVTYTIINAADAAESMTVKNAGASTIGTVSQNEKASFYSDGTNWLLVDIVAIALA